MSESEYRNSNAIQKTNERDHANDFSRRVVVCMQYMNTEQSEHTFALYVSRMRLQKKKLTLNNNNNNNNNLRKRSIVCDWRFSVVRFISFFHRCCSVCANAKRNGKRSQKRKRRKKPTVTASILMCFFSLQVFRFLSSI